MSEISNNNQRPPSAADAFLNNPQPNSTSLTNATRKKKWEDHFERKTFYIEKNTFKELERRADGEKGKKTEIINRALQEYMNYTPPLPPKENEKRYY